MTKDEALKLALEALKRTGNIAGFAHEREQAVITAIDEVLAQPVQEPVGSVVRWLDGSLVHGWFSNPPPEGTLLYITSPAVQPQRPWVGLTDEEKLDLLSDAKGMGGRICGDGQLFSLLEEHEAKLKEKNT